MPFPPLAHATLRPVHISIAGFPTLPLSSSASPGLCSGSACPYCGHAPCCHLSPFQSCPPCCPASESSHVLFLPSSAAAYGG